MKNCVLGSIFILLLCFCVQPLWADIIIYTDRAAWNADLIYPAITETFESATPGPIIGTTTVGFLDITTSAVSSIDTAPGNVNGSQEFHTYPRIILGEDYVTEIQIPFLANAFGADYYSTNTGWGLRLDVAGETVDFTTIPGYLNSGFVGVISDAPFSQLMYHSEAEEFWVDDMTFAQVPEPTSILLLGTGLGALGLVAYRRKRK